MDGGASNDDNDNIRVIDVQPQMYQVLCNSTNVKYTYQYVLPTEEQMPQLSIADGPEMDETDPLNEFIDMSTYYQTERKAVTSDDASLKEKPPFMPLQQTSQAVEMAIASEIEIPTPWIDSGVLASNSVIQTEKLLASCIALPTEIPSYMNLPYNTVNTAISGYVGEAGDDEPRPCDIDVGPNFENLQLGEMANLNVGDAGENTKLQTTAPTSSFLRESSPSDNDEFVRSLLLDGTKIDLSDASNLATDLVNDDSILTDLLLSFEDPNFTGLTVATGVDSSRDMSGNMLDGSSANGDMLIRSKFGPDTTDDANNQNNDVAKNDENIENHIRSTNWNTEPTPSTSMTNATAKLLIDNRNSDACQSGSCHIKPNNSDRKESKNDNSDAENILKSIVDVSGGTNSKTMCDDAKCSCRSPQCDSVNGCCVVICLKTFDQLRKALSHRSTMNLLRCSGARGIVG